VVKLNENDEIIELVEKPSTFVSDQAVIGIYYFKDVTVLKQKLQEVLDENITHGGEYQINDGIKRMMAEGRIFKTGTVDEWMDCGNKEVAVDTNAKTLGFLKEDGEEQMIASSVTMENSSIIEPCFIGENVKLINAKIGPNVSIGDDCVVENSLIQNSLIQTNSIIKNANLENAMIGNHVKYNGEYKTVSIGDYTVLE
jgi:glucose-1-phosphate thymidylyltransferase